MTAQLKDEPKITAGGKNQPKRGPKRGLTGRREDKIEKQPRKDLKTRLSPKREKTQGTP